MMVSVERVKAEMVGKLIAPALARLTVDTFEDRRYYPPPGTNRRDLMAYFLVMVAMDHRLSRPGRDYEGYVGGELYHGADLLYRLGAEMFERDRSFFYPERLKSITVKDVLNWLMVKGKSGREIRPPDPEVRAELLRDLGVKLEALFNGDPFEIVVRSKGFLRLGVAEGLIDLLKVFKAYQDPVEKKAFLLAKFIERRGIVRFQDPQDKEVPVDNHLTRIALRTGIVDVDRETLERIAANIEFEPFEDAYLRMAVRQAYRLVAQAAGADPFILDDFLWTFGRRCCTLMDPSCASGCGLRCRQSGGCEGNSCVLAPACKAFTDRLYMVPEHKFLNTWWY